MSSEREYYENPANVEGYSKFTPSHDGADLVDAMRAWLPDGGTLLELGMGPGKDLDLLAEHYQVTGSDFSNAFLERYRAKHPDADLVNLDALTIETDRSFDGIFSNKVLVHMSAEDLNASFARQAEVLNPGGVMLHSFWYGEGEEQFGGLTLHRRNEAVLERLVKPHLELLALERHAKMKDGDSIYVVARRPLA
jgi:cyclopropane fatty-acyl-phospholipid synthase-like methyltransferase